VPLSPDERTCTGITINWPDDVQPFLMMFPWESYHDGPNALPFTVDITHPSDPSARLKHCHSTMFENSPCSECVIVVRNHNSVGMKRPYLHELSFDH
jgi:hypothetical protein